MSTIYIFQRARVDCPPKAPSSELLLDGHTGQFSGDLEGWAPVIPEPVADGITALYITHAPAYARVEPAHWSPVSMLLAPGGGWTDAPSKEVRATMQSGQVFTALARSDGTIVSPWKKSPSSHA